MPACAHAYVPATRPYLSRVLALLGLRADGVVDHRPPIHLLLRRVHGEDVERLGHRLPLTHSAALLRLLLAAHDEPVLLLPLHLEERVARHGEQRRGQSRKVL